MSNKIEIKYLKIKTELRHYDSAQTRSKQDDLKIRQETKY